MIFCDSSRTLAQERSSYTSEIAKVIVEAESGGRNVCNTNGCRYGIGPFQIVQSTFDEQCEGNIYNEKDNRRCGLQMIEDEQYWRWEQSMEVWLYKLPPKIRDYVKIRCECMSAVRFWGLDIPLKTDLSKLEGNTVPVKGAGVILQYPKSWHIAIITKLMEKGFLVKESNFQKCKITERFIEWNNIAIKGFYK